MKKIKLLTIIIASFLLFSCAETKNSKKYNLKADGTGACTKCSCKSWRPDHSEDPPNCLNIRVPKKTLCLHSKKDHK